MRFTLFAFCCCALLSLGACTNYPNPMARGYSSYAQAYKSAPGPTVDDIGYDYSYHSNKSVLKDIRYVASDLVEKLDKKLAMNVEEVYLKVQSDNAFYNSFDYIIRDELTKRGYLLAISPVNTLTLDLVVESDLPECTGVEQGEGVYKKMFLALAINVNEGIPQDLVGDYYEVPAYDFEAGENGGIEINLCPEEEQVVDVYQAVKDHEEIIVPEEMIVIDLTAKEPAQKDVSDIIPELLETQNTEAPEEAPE